MSAFDRFSLQSLVNPVADMVGENAFIGLFRVFFYWEIRKSEIDVAILR